MPPKRKGKGRNVFFQEAGEDEHVLPPEDVEVVEPAPALQQVTEDLDDDVEEESRSAKKQAAQGDAADAPPIPIAPVPPPIFAPLSLRGAFRQAADESPTLLDLDESVEPDVEPIPSRAGRPQQDHQPIRVVSRPFFAPWLNPVVTRRALSPPRTGGDDVLTPPLVRRPQTQTSDHTTTALVPRGFSYTTTPGPVAVGRGPPRASKRSTTPAAPSTTPSPFEPDIVKHRKVRDPSKTTDSDYVPAESGGSEDDARAEVEESEKGKGDVSGDSEDVGDADAGSRSIGNEEDETSARSSTPPLSPQTAHLAPPSISRPGPMTSLAVVAPSRDADAVTPSATPFSLGPTPKFVDDNEDDDDYEPESGTSDSESESGRTPGAKKPTQKNKRKVAKAKSARNPRLNPTQPTPRRKRRSETEEDPLPPLEAPRAPSATPTFVQLPNAPYIPPTLALAKQVEESPSFFVETPRPSPSASSEEKEEGEEEEDTGGPDVDATSAFQDNTDYAGEYDDTDNDEPVSPTVGVRAVLPPSEPTPLFDPFAPTPPPIGSESPVAFSPFAPSPAPETRRTPPDVGDDVPATPAGPRANRALARPFTAGEGFRAPGPRGGPPSQPEPERPARGEQPPQQGPGRPGEGKEEEEPEAGGGGPPGPGGPPQDPNPNPNAAEVQPPVCNSTAPWKNRRLTVLARLGMAAAAAIAAAGGGAVGGPVAPPGAEAEGPAELYGCAVPLIRAYMAEGGGNSEGVRRLFCSLMSVSANPKAWDIRTTARSIKTWLGKQPVLPSVPRVDPATREPHTGVEGYIRHLFDTVDQPVLFGLFVILFGPPSRSTELEDAIRAEKTRTCMGVASILDHVHTHGPAGFQRYLCAPSHLRLQAKGPFTPMCLLEWACPAYNPKELCETMAGPHARNLLLGFRRKEYADTNRRVAGGLVLAAACLRAVLWMNPQTRALFWGPHPHDGPPAIPMAWDANLTVAAVHNGGPDIVPYPGLQWLLAPPLCLEDVFQDLIDALEHPVLSPAGALTNAAILEVVPDPMPPPGPPEANDNMFADPCATAWAPIHGLLAKDILRQGMGEGLPPFNPHDLLRQFGEERFGAGEFKGAEPGDHHGDDADVDEADADEPAVAARNPRNIGFLLAGEVVAALGFQPVPSKAIDAAGVVYLQALHEWATGAHGGAGNAALWNRALTAIFHPDHRQREAIRAQTRVMCAANRWRPTNIAQRIRTARASRRPGNSTTFDDVPSPTRGPEAHIDAWSFPDISRMWPAGRRQPGFRKEQARLKGLLRRVTDRWVEDLILEFEQHVQDATLLFRQQHDAWGPALASLARKLQRREGKPFVLASALLAMLNPPPHVEPI